MARWSPESFLWRRVQPSGGAERFSEFGSVGLWLSCSLGEPSPVLIRSVYSQESSLLLLVLYYLFLNYLY